MIRFIKKKAVPIFLAVMMLASSLSSLCAFASSYDFSYSGISEKGLYVGEDETAIMQLKDKDSNYFSTYCVDRETEIDKSVKYARSNISDGTYYSKENADKIRAIVRNAYPFISIEEVRTRSQISNLSVKEAIAGTQAAIWHYANDNDIKFSNKNAKKLYNWLISLDGAEKSKTEVSGINITFDSTKNNDRFEALIKFQATGKNVDGSQIHLNYTFDRDLKATYNATVVDEGVDQSGNRVVRVKDLPLDAKFNVTAYGNQVLESDGYLYSPQGGRSASQTLVGVYQGNTNISSDLQVSYQEQARYKVTINKVDSITLQGLEGAIFEIANTKDFNDIVYTAKSQQDGTAVCEGLTAGNWFIREIQSPKGYIPYEGVYTVSVGPGGETKLDFKNTPYGKIIVLKTDENNNPIAGALFDLYKGDQVKEENLIKKDITTDDNGKILLQDIMPGIYTIQETYAPEAYHKDANPITIEVLAGEEKSVQVINPSVIRGKILIEDRDAVSNDRLEGAKIGVYKDKDCTELIAEFSSELDNWCELGNLLPGKYYVKQLDPPSGYLLNSKVHELTLEEGQTLNLTIYNTRVPVTAGNYALALFIGISMLAVTTTGFYIYKRSKKLNEMSK